MDFRPARFAKRLALAAVLSSSLALTSPASAQSLADRETARTLMDEGDAKRDAKDYKGALDAYAKADAIMHVPTTGLEVARMQVELGMLLEARETLGRVLRLPVKPNEPAPFTAARKAADQLNEDVGRRVPALELVVKGAAGDPTVTIDGENVPPAVLSVPRKVNPGKHVVVAKAGTAEAREEITVEEGATKTVTLELVDQAPPPPPVAANTEESSGGGAASKVLMFGGFGVAAIGIGVGTVTGLMSMSKVDDIKQDCVGDKCLASRAGDIDDAKSLGNLSTIAFAVGGAGAVAGIVGLVMSRGGSESKPEPQTGARARAVVGPSYVGLAGTF